MASTTRFKSAMDCDELERQLVDAGSLDHRLGALLLHNVQCRECAGGSWLEDMIDRLIAARYAQQIRRRALESNERIA